MNTIDWNKAPEATHYDTRPGCVPAFMRKNHNGRDWEFLGMGGHWVMYGPICDSQLAGLIERPKLWTGEGLPPVGTVCEYNTLEMHPVDNSLRWDRVRIVAHDKQGPDTYAVFASTSGYHGNRLPEAFRPIRTAEQIKAEERDEAIHDLMGTTCITMGEAARIYDAGYRKQVQP